VPQTSSAPAIDGWFAADPEPHLIGTRCGSCGTYHFPPERFACRNPACGAQSLEDTPLSRRGMVWSFSINHYPPPDPGPRDVPTTVAAVELATEQMVILGIVSGDGPLQIGDAVEVVVEPLPDGALVWKWRRT
jgi:uncharacterized protein